MAALPQPQNRPYFQPHLHQRVGRYRSHDRRPGPRHRGAEVARIHCLLRAATVRSYRALVAIHSHRVASRHRAAGRAPAFGQREGILCRLPDWSPRCDRHPRFHMPARMAGATAVYGLPGLFPIGWIVLNVIFLYQLTVEALSI